MYVINLLTAFIRFMYTYIVLKGTNMIKYSVHIDVHVCMYVCMYVCKLSEKLVKIFNLSQFNDRKDATAPILLECVRLHLMKRLSLQMGDAADVSLGQVDLV